MFTGIQSYTSRGYAAPREMGEYCPPQKKQPEYREYRGREMGEYNVPSREEQQAYYDRADSGMTTPVRSNEYRPREVGEKPEDVVRNQPREKTEQEKRLDLFA